MTGPEPPTRDVILAAVMPALLAAQRSAGTPGSDETGAGTVVASSPCVVAGLAVARETFARLGARFRATVDEGASILAGEVVAEVGGPVDAIRGAAPVALAFLGRLSAVASGVREPDPEDALERYAAELAGGRLSPSVAVDDDGPSFRLGSVG